MPHTTLAMVSAVTIFVVCGFAIIAGSWRERMGGVVYLIDHVLNFLLGQTFPELFLLRYLLSDSICLLGFFYLCWKSPHPWPLWAFGFQFTSIMTAMAALVLGPDLLRWTFLTIEMAVGGSVLVVLLVGTVSALRARSTGAGLSQIG